MTTNNVMQQLRSPTTAAPASLLPGQLAYSNATGGSGVLYIGSTDGATVVPIAGVRTPGVLTANQALVANSTSGLNNVITGTLTLAGNSSVSGVIAANGTGNVGSAGWVLFSGGTSSNAGTVVVTLPPACSTAATAAAEAPETVMVTARPISGSSTNTMSPRACWA